MIESLTAIGFATPYALLTVPFAASVLVYAYRKRGRGHREVVASVLILRKLKTTLSARQKFVPPPRFFVELLLVALLGLAAAGAYRQAPQERIALVLDNSLGMAARVGGESRLEAAKTDLRSFIESLSANTRLGLFATSPLFHQVGQGLLTPGGVLQELEAIQIAYGPDALQGVLGKLTQDPDFDRVVAWSDKALDAPRARLQVRSAGLGKAANVAITEISLDTRSERSAAVVAEIAAFAGREVTVAAHLTGFREVAGTISGVKLAEKQVTVPASGSAQVEFPVDIASNLAFSVRIEPSSRAGDAAVDAILEDDLAFVAPSGGGNQLNVVTASPQSAESLTRLPAISPSFMTPEQYRIAPPREGTLLFHRTVPSEFPPVNSVFMLPPPDSQLGGKLVQGQSIPISRWQEGHPLLSYLNVPLLSLKALVPLQRPGWAEEVVASTYGTVVFAGEYTGHRYVALGFDLLPFGGRRDPLASVLLLNILKWVSGAALSSGYEIAPYRIPTEQAAPSQRPQEVRYVAAAAPQGLEGRGDERVAPVPGLLAIGGTAKRTVRAVDFFSEEESNTWALQTLDIPEIGVVSVIDERGADSLSNTLVWLVLVVLGVEFAWALLRAGAGRRLGVG